MYKFSKYREQYRANLKLAIPVMLSQLGHVIVQVADNAMVGSYGGDNPLPLAAAAFGGSIFFIFFVTTMGLTFSITPLVGELFAQKRFISTVKYLQNSVVLYLVVSLLMSGVMFACVPLMWRMGQPAEVVAMAIPFYKMLIYSLLPAMLFFVFKQFLEGLGNTKIAMYAVVSSNVVNIFFNWLLIGGEWGFPEMGTEGAGLATLISRYVLLLISIGYLLFGRDLRLYRELFTQRLFSVRIMRKTLMQGFPIALQIFLEASSFVVVTFLFGWFGTAAISANQIGIAMSNCSFMIIVALGSATTIRVSHCYGLRDVPQMRLASHAAWHLALGWNICAAIFFFAMRYRLPMLFSSNEGVIELGSYILLFVAAYQIPDAVQCIGVGVMRGMQRMKDIPQISFFAYWVCNIPVGYLCAFHLGMGPLGLHVGFISGFAVAAIWIIIKIKRVQCQLESV